MGINLSEKIKAYHRYSQRGQEIHDKFIINITPKWFTFLGWLSLLIALSYFFQETRSIFILVGKMVKNGVEKWCQLYF